MMQSVVEVTVNRLILQTQDTSAVQAFAAARPWLSHIPSALEIFFGGTTASQRGGSYWHDCDTERMVASLENTPFYSQINCFSSCIECFAVYTHILRCLLNI